MSRPFFLLVALTVVGASILFSAKSAPSAPAQTSVKVPKELLQKQLETARAVFREDLARLRTRAKINCQVTCLHADEFHSSIHRDTHCV